MTPTQENHITVAEAVKRAGVSRETIYRWLREGRLTRYKRAANRTVIDPNELDEILRPKPEQRETG